MIISHQKKIIFIHIQRTGGTSIRYILQDKLNGEYNILPQHDNTQTIPRELLRQYNNYFSFAFVRNPWDRIFSWFSLIKKTSGKSQQINNHHFTQFLTDLEFDLKNTTSPYFHFNQLDYICDYANKIWVNKIGRFENFENDLYEILQHIGISDVQIPHLNETNSDYKNFYTQKSINFVAEKCRRDIEYFGYNFNTN